MSKLFHFMENALRVLWEIVLPVPMPWRASLIIVTIILFLYHVGWRFLSWSIEKLSYIILFVIEGVASLILLPEYWLTKWLRQHNHSPLPGTYILGDILQSLVSFANKWTGRVAEIRHQWRLRKAWVIILLIASIPLLLWYARSGLEDTTTAARYIDRAMAWWSSLERQVLNSN